MTRWFDHIIKDNIGIMDYYLNPPLDDKMLAINMSDLLGPFYLLAIGLTLVSIVFLVEIIVFRINNGKWFRRVRKIPVLEAKPPRPTKPIFIYLVLLRELPHSKRFSPPNTIS